MHPGTNVREGATDGVSASCCRLWQQVMGKPTGVRAEGDGATCITWGAERTGVRTMLHGWPASIGTKQNGKTVAR